MLLNNSDLTKSKFLVITGDIINVRDFHRDVIRTFLNVIMGYQNLDDDNFALILPIVYKYDVTELFKKIINFIKDKPNFKIMVLSLNVALKLNYDELLDYCFDFIFQYGVNKFFEEEKENCYLLLEPNSVLFLMRAAQKNYLFLKRIQSWAIHYMKKNNIQKDMRSFLSDHKFSLLKLDDVKSFDKVLDLYSNDPGIDLFEPKYYLDSLKNIANDSKMKCEWVEIKAGGSLAELFSVKYPIHIGFTIPHKPYFLVSFNSLIPNESFIGNRSDLFEPSLSLGIYEIIKNDSSLDYKDYTLRLQTSKIHFSNSKFSCIFCPCIDSSYCITSVCIKYKFLKDCTILKAKFDMDSELLPVAPQTNFGMNFTKRIEIIKATEIDKLFVE